MEEEEDQGGVEEGG